jgi:cell fate (sporulation/competence/biofilm development) regulator YlbF (YheA/YmcA/DUF963 family)
MANNRTDGQAHVLQLADALGAALKNSEVVQHFTAVEQRFRTDPNVQRMLKTLRQEAEKFQHAERTGNLSEEQLQEFRDMQARFQSHPLLRNLQEAREAAGFLLKETNSIISQILGIDFGRTAGPAGGAC